MKSQQELVNQINAGRWAQFIERVIKRLDVYRFMSAVMFGACVVLLGLNTTITHVASYTSLYISFFMLVTCICYNEVVRSAVEGFGCHNIQLRLTLSLVVTATICHTLGNCSLCVSVIILVYEKHGVASEATKIFSITCTILLFVLRPVLVQILL